MKKGMMKLRLIRLLILLTAHRTKVKEEKIAEGVRTKMMPKSESWFSRKKGNVS